MKDRFLKLISFSVYLLFAYSQIWAQETYTVRTKKIIAPIPLTLWGIFTIGDARHGAKITITILSNQDLNTMNSLNAPNAIEPATSEILIKGKLIPLDLKPYLLSIIAIPIK